MVECLQEACSGQGLRYHNGGRKVAQLFLRDTVSVCYVDHNLVLPALSDFRYLFIQDFHFGILGGQHYTPESPPLVSFRHLSVLATPEPPDLPCPKPMVDGLRQHATASAKC